MSHLLECNYEELTNYQNLGFSSKCEYVKNICSTEFEYIDNATFYFCTLDENIILFTLYSIVYISIIFHLLSSTSEYYLGPMLSKLVKILKFSESLAGVTLLAFANGAPDIIASYTGNIKPGPEGIPLAIGALLGAGIFTICIALGRVIFISKKIELIPNTFLRDVIFYMITSVSLLVLGYMEKIKLWSAIAFFSIYIIFVIKAVYDEIKTEPLDDSLIELRSLPEIPNELDFSSSDIEVVKNDLQQESNSVPNPVQHLAPKGTSLNENHVRKPHAFKTGFILGEKDYKLFMSEVQINQIRGGIFRKLFGYYEAIIDLLRDCTIPNVEESKYFRIRFALYPLLTGLFIIWRIGFFQNLIRHPSFAAIFLNAAFFLGLVFYAIGQMHSFKNRVSSVTYFFGFVVSILWIQLSAVILVDYLTFLEIASNMPANLIGLTILAWGNSTNDYFVDTTLAKKGFGVMVVAAVIGGQYFNLNVGLGIVIITQVLMEGELEFSLFDGTEVNRLNLVLIFSAIIILVSTIVYTKLNHYTLQKPFAYLLIGIYVIFMITVIALCL